MATLFMMTHDVKDFDQWKKGFDEGEAMRASAGIKLKNIYRDADNENRITVITEITDRASAQSFMQNPALKEAMEKAGVTSQPEIRFLNEV